MIFAALHVYWAAGGSFGLAESAGRDLATRRPTAFVLFGLWGVALLLLIGAGLGVSLARPWTSGTVRRVLRGCGWMVGAGLLARGIVLQVALLTDTAGVASTVGNTQTAWSLGVWNPWFIIGGIVFVFAAYCLRGTPGRETLL